MRLKPAAFIFDMDGVIIDSEPIHSRVKMDTFHHFDLPFDEADLIHYMGRTSDEIFGEVILEVLQSGTIAPIEGAVELIRHLYDEGIPLALATSSWERVMDTVLDAFKIRSYFRSVISGSTLPKSKPDPAIYLLSAERLGVPPKDCLVLEDTAAGVLAAKRAGMRCIGFRSPHSGAQDLSLADTVVSRLSDVNV